MAGFPLSRSQKSFKFSERDSEKYLGLSTLLRTPDKSIMPPRMAEFNGGIDISGKPLKTIFRTFFSFIQFNAEVDQKFCNWAENMPVLAGRLVEIIEFLLI